MDLCINEVCLMQSGDLLSHIEDCARHGIRYMEVRKTSLLQYLRTGRTLDELKGAFREYGVTPACLNSIESISFNNKRGMRVLKEMSEYLFYCCKAIGCDCVEVIGSFKVPTDSLEEIHENTVQALTQLSDAAKPYGVRLALEYMGVPDSSVKTFGQALSIVNAVDRDNVGLLLDTWHHYAMGSVPEEILQAKNGQVFMVHTSDCPRRKPGEALRPESYLPGDGVVEIGKMLEYLGKVGYRGPVSVEVMDPALQALPAAELLELSKERTLPLLEGV